VIRKEILSKPDLILQGSSSTRRAVRGVVFQDDKYLMLYSQRDGDYSFPGGGIEAGESEQAALKRELLEECGAEVIAISSPIAETTEIDPSEKPDIDIFIRKNVYFSCQISDKRIEPNLMPYEEAHQCTAVWIDLEEALACNNRILSKTDTTPPRWTKRETMIMRELLKL
jgi:8-oxo-dGTP diphosphatase